MASVLTDATILWNGIDLTGHSNSVSGVVGREMLDETVWGSTARRNRAGLFTAGLGVEGFFDSTVDKALFDDHDTGGQAPCIIAPSSGSVGDLCYMYNVTAAEYTPGPRGSVGELQGFSWSAESASPPVRSTLLYFTTTDAAITSTALNLGASTNKLVYAALLVFAGSGTFTVKVRSAANEDFDSSPTDRITFAEVATGTARTAQWATPVAGVAQEWWRIETTGTLTGRKVAVAVGFL